MKQLVLELRRPLTVPTNADMISPTSLASKSLDEIRQLKLWEGNHQTELGDIFTVKGETNGPASESCVLVSGDARKLSHLGYRMMSGLLQIAGPAGMYVGEEMVGGTIHVEGDSGSWLGSKMQGGVIEVYGNAGDHIGAPYRGSRDGMKGGSITVHGNAGTEVGCWMSGGFIRIKRSADTFPGIHMCDGTVLIDGDCKGRAGGGMTGGRVVISGRMEDVLPSFTIEEIRDAIKFGEEKIQGPFYVFRGDLCNQETGRIFISVTKNPQLKAYEQYLESWQL